MDLDQKSGIFREVISMSVRNLVRLDCACVPTCVCVCMSVYHLILPAGQYNISYYFISDFMRVCMSVCPHV